MGKILNIVAFRIILPWLGTIICQSTFFKTAFTILMIGLPLTFGKVGFMISFAIFTIYPPVFQNKIWNGIKTNELKTVCVLKVVEWTEDYTKQVEILKNQVEKIFSLHLAQYQNLSTHQKHDAVT